jgi:hypothetical protein
MPHMAANPTISLVARILCSPEFHMVESGASSVKAGRCIAATAIKRSAVCSQVTVCVQPASRAGTIQALSFRVP